MRIIIKVFKEWIKRNANSCQIMTFPKASEIKLTECRRSMRFIELLLGIGIHGSQMV